MHLFRRAIELDPDPPKWYRLILAVDAYRRGDGPAALSEIRNGAVVRIPIAYIVGTAILAEFGEMTEADATAASGRDICPSLFDNSRAQIRTSCPDPLVAERLINSLRRGGFVPGGEGASSAASGSPGM